MTPGRLLAALAIVGSGRTSAQGAVAGDLPCAAGRPARHCAGVDSTRFSRVAAAIQQAGYSRAVMIVRGLGQADGLFVWSAGARGDSGVLVVALDQAAQGTKPVVIERARTPAELGARTVRITPFLGARDLFDVEVNHQPFRLETTRTFGTHHVLRRQAAALSAVCDLDGGSSSSYSTRRGTNTATRAVSIVKVPMTTLAFSVRTVAKTVQRRARGAAETVDSTESVRWYDLPLVGTCREVRAPGQ